MTAAALQYGQGGLVKGVFVQRLGLTVIACAVLVAGCNAADDALAPRSNDGVSVHRNADCQVDGTGCMAIWNAIQFMLNHANSPCRTIGVSAYGRYVSTEPEVGYYSWPQPVNSPTALAGVVMANTGTGPTGWTAANGTVGVYPRFFNSSEGDANDPAFAAKMVAHEEMHQSGEEDPFHQDGAAAEAQAACAEN